MTTRSTTTRLVLGALAGLALLTAGPVLTASAAAAGPRTTVASAAAQQVTFGVQPASSGRPDSRPNLSYGTTPGSTVRDQVAVVNFSTAVLTLTVYATDAVNTAGGGFGLLPGGQKPTDAGAWTSVGGRSGGQPARVTVPGRRASGPGFVVLPLVLHVPAGAVPGDHVGGVVAVLSTLGTGSQGAKVRLDQRVATRLFVRVSGTPRPQLAIEDLASSYRSGALGFGRGTVTVSYTVHNTGNVSLGARQSVTVAGPFGAAGAAVAVPDVPLLLPGASVRESVQVAGVLPLVHLTSTIVLRPTHPAGAVDPGLASEVVASTSVWAIPWVLVVVILAVVALGLWWQRRHLGGPGAQERGPLPGRESVPAGQGASR